MAKGKGKPFTKGNPGKPVGAVNKVNKQIKEVFSDVFDYLQTDPDAKKKKADLKQWAKENPKDFYLIASKLFPIQMQHSGEIKKQILYVRSTTDSEGEGNGNIR